jgi:hypothetical protein
MSRFAGSGRPLAILAAALGLWLAPAARAEAQLGTLLSPGPLARPHAQLEGLSNCQRCHEQGRRVTAEKCLSCHTPIRERIVRRSGVHRDVTTDCVACHVEHAGVDGELRPFDTARFNHARDAGFPLDGKHAPVAASCAACHKTRTFLAANTSCAACHTDVHKGALGPACSSCHSASVAFKELGGRFDHSKSRFPLTGAHRTAACAACHRDRVFKGVRSESCTNCHADPHRERFGASCQSCHTTEVWRTTKVDHTRTSYPLLGRHARVACASCHKQPALRVHLKADTCAACHADPHRGTFRQDCKSCHSENGFEKAPFNHTTTAFALTGKHAAAPCAACHTQAAAPARPARGAPPARGATSARGGTAAARRPPVRAPAAKLAADFKGLKTACASCHRDVHGGELGAACENCHSSSDFAVRAYTHKRNPELFGGLHAPLACERCHVKAPARPVRTAATLLDLKFTTTSTSCASCHTDVHLGQLRGGCEACHTVASVRFAASGFSHAKASFALTGKHETTGCEKCHVRETAAFPAGRGIAVRYAPIATACRSCHADVHFGQVTTACETCHVTSSFHVARYRHQSNALIASGFFAGRHAPVPCQSCHRAATGRFPAGPGTAVQFAVSTDCVACHQDVHFGSLGPRCGDCHRP